MVRIYCCREVNQRLESRYKPVSKRRTCGYRSRLSRVVHQVRFRRTTFKHSSSSFDEELHGRSYLVTVLEIRRAIVSGLMKTRLVTTGRRGTRRKFNRKMALVFPTSRRLSFPAHRLCFADESDKLTDWRWRRNSSVTVLMLTGGRVTFSTQPARL